MRPELAVIFPRAAVDGGVERMALDLLQDQSQRRSTVFVGTELLPSHAVRHVRVPPARVPRALRPLTFRRDAGKAVGRLRPQVSLSLGVECPPGDVYWVQSVHAAWLAEGGQVYLRGRPVPPALRRLKPAHQVLLGLERDYFTRHRPRLIMCTSPREVADLQRIYGVDPAITAILPDWYDEGVFAPERARSMRAAGRAAIGAHDDDLVVLMVANEWHRKGLATAIQALAAVQIPSVRLDLVGAPPPDSYRQLAHRLGVADRVRWHGRSSDVARYFAAADIFALPTAYEPFGIVIAEAMACGVATVTSRFAGASAAIDDGVSGLLLDDPQDPQELLRAWRTLADPDGRARIGAAGSQAIRRFERRTVIDEFDRLVFGAAP